MIATIMMTTMESIPNERAKEGEMPNTTDDLRKRAETLSAEPGTNLYKKALKWQELALETIERLEIMESRACKAETLQRHEENIM